MKTYSPFRTLLKYELGHGFSGGPGWAAFFALTYWFFGGIFLWGIPFTIAHGNLAVLFETGLLPIMAFVFSAWMAVWMAHVLVPDFNDFLTTGTNDPTLTVHRGAFEFLFTRGLERKTVFRARLTAFFIYAMSPFLVTAALSPLASPVGYGPGDMSAAEASQIRQQYQQAFPASQLARDRTGKETDWLIIPHGNVTYSAWMVWNAVLAFALLQGYGALVARRVKPGELRSLLYPVAPLFIITAVMLIVQHGRPQYAINALVEQEFLFFARYPLGFAVVLAAVAAAVQVWSEERFNQLETL